ncbi:MAG: PD-(D/E)XK nuclease family protein, partial [Candidatus Hodarchaeota archaeon]
MTLDDFLTIPDNSKTFSHGNIAYTFKYKDINPAFLEENATVRRLFEYLTKVIKSGAFPHKLFNSNYPRASRMKIKGLSKTQKNFLQQYILRNGYVQRFTSETSDIPKLVDKVFQNVKNAGIKKKPNHEPVLNYLLSKDKKSVAIETPVWLESRILTGHVDLIQVENSNGYEIKILDYKPENESKFLYSIPQIALYAMMLKERLKRVDNCEINCYIFDRKTVWKFKPNLLNILGEKLERYNLEVPWTG